MSPEPPDLPPSVSPPDALATDAVAAQLADAHHTAGNTHCLNCGTQLTGPFCSACGQHDFDFHRSFRHVFMEALEGIFHFDGKFFGNLTTLLFRPGRLTAEFNAGRRASQVPPFRLYIFTAFVFFLLLFARSSTPPAIELDPPSRGSAVNIGGQPATFAQAVEELGEELSPVPAAPAPAAGRNTPKISVVPFDKPEAEKSDLERWLETQGRRATQPDFQRELGHRFVAALPKMLLFCLPVFALFTRVLYRKSGQVYLQHLVLALHLHTFIFLWLMFRDGWVFLFDLIGLAAVSRWTELAANAWFVLYPVLMLRRLFGNSWPRTLGKTLVLALGYALFIAFAFFLTAVVLFLLM